MTDKTQILHENEWITLKYHPDERYLHHQTHKAADAENFGQVLSVFIEGLKFMSENKVEKWLSDERKTMTPDNINIDEKSLAWGKQAAAAGWKYWAMVVPETLAGRAGMQSIIEMNYNLGIRVAVFTDVDEARNWLVKL